MGRNQQESPCHRLPNHNKIKPVIHWEERKVTTKAKPQKKIEKHFPTGTDQNSTNICWRKVITRVRGVDIDQGTSAIIGQSVTKQATVAAVGGERSHLVVRYQLRERIVAVTEQLDETE